MAEANAAILAGMLPFGSVVVRDGTIISRAGRQTLNSSTGHAEVLAMGKLKLSGCTLYSTVEPGAMCSFIAREAQVARVVYGLSSSIMGGHTRWPILQAFLGRLMGHRWRKVTSTGERDYAGLRNARISSAVSSGRSACGLCPAPAMTRNVAPARPSA